jgi:cytochrome o ubiquinol oxidase subunit 1
MMGATRRLDHYDSSTGWQPLFMVSLVGVIIIGCAVGIQIWQLIVSIRERDQNRDTTGDPWNGRSLEWSTPSPAPFYNFAVIPQVQSRDAFWEMKTQTKKQAPVIYHDIVLPKNTPMGIYLSGFVFLFGLSMVWHAFFFAIVGLLGAICCVIYRSFDEDSEYILTASEIEKIEKKIRK